MSTTTNLSSLVINYLTQAQYDAAAQAGTLNENQIYLTPAVELATVATSGDYNDLLNKPNLAAVMSYKGTKANYAALPSSGNSTGDVWHLTDTGAEYTWDGSTWQELGTAISLNGSSTTSASFYAPTTAGTSGYYLKSNGSGAPTWATIPAGVTVTLNGSTTTTPSFYAPTTAGTSGQVLTSNGSGAPIWSAITVPTKTSDLTNDSGFITGMTILSYGSSTWQNFIDAYDANKVVYCRASSNSNPASGSQTRLAFMAYVNNATTPTEVEFQYYRSVSTHTASQQGDQVYVYKLNKTNGWSVTVREASVKVVAGTGLGGTYSNGTMTLTGPTISLNGSSTTSASFYAPTTAGTSGQVLTSNGSGAPTWAASTATPTASTIAKFDSSAHMNSSDMSAQDISDFIDALDVSGGAYQWKLAGTVTGNVNTVTVPNNAQEVIVIIEATSGVIYSDIALVSSLRAIWTVGGYYLASNDIGLCNLNVSNGNKTFQIRNCRYGAGDYKTTATLSVYYKSFEVPQEVADYVVEQGTDSIWTYRKWESGISECWGIWTGNLTHYYSGGSLQGYSCTVTFPTNLFISTPLVNVDGRIGNGFYLGTSIDVSAISSANIVAMSTSSGTVACTFHIHAIGKWK